MAKRNLALVRAKYEAARHELVTGITERLSEASPRVLLTIVAILSADTGTAGGPGRLSIMPEGVVVKRGPKSKGRGKARKAKTKAELRVATATMTKWAEGKKGRLSQKAKAELVGVIVRVMGTRTLTIPAVVERVLDKLPPVRDPASYVGHILRARPEFALVERGVYQVRGAAGKGKPSAGSKPVTLKRLWSLISRKGLRRHMTVAWMAQELGCRPRQLAAILGRLSSQGWLDQYDDGTWHISKKGRREAGKGDG